MELEDSLDCLKGIGEKTKQIFQKTGIENLRDLITYYPRTYEAYEPPKEIRALSEGEVAAVAVQLTAPPATRYIRGLSVSTALCSDGSEAMAVTWFNIPEHSCRSIRL